MIFNHYSCHNVPLFMIYLKHNFLSVFHFRYFITECINIDTHSDGVFHIITSDETSIEKEQTDPVIQATSSVTPPNTNEFNHTDELATIDYVTETESTFYITTSSTTLQSISSNSHSCQVVASEFLDGIKWNSSLPVKPNVSRDNTIESEEQVTWNFELDEDKIPSVRVS